MDKTQASWPVSDLLLASAIADAKTTLKHNPNAALEYDNKVFDSTAVDMYWACPEQLKTFLKNNVGRSSKRATLIRDSNYKGQDPKKRKRAIFCLKILDLALIINPKAFSTTSKLDDSARSVSPSMVLDEVGGGVAKKAKRSKNQSKDQSKGMSKSKSKSKSKSDMKSKNISKNIGGSDAGSVSGVDNEADDEEELEDEDSADMEDYDLEDNSIFRATAQYSSDNPSVSFNQAISSLVAMQRDGPQPLPYSPFAAPAVTPISPRKQHMARFSTALAASNYSGRIPFISTAQDPCETPSLSAGGSPMSTSSFVSNTSYDSYRSKSPFATININSCMSPTPPPQGLYQQQHAPLSFVIQPFHICTIQRQVGVKISHQQLSQEELDVAFILEGLSSSSSSPSHAQRSRASSAASDISSISDEADDFATVDHHTKKLKITHIL